MSGAWWRDHFGDAYFHLHEPLFPEEDSRGEVAAMLELLGLPAGARVLDLACGWGRHTALFGEAGLDAVGADLSVPLLRRAVERAGRAGSGRAGRAGSERGRRPGSERAARRAGASAGGMPEEREAAAPSVYFTAADLRALPFADGAFDGVVNVFTSLGLFLDDDEDIRALREAHRVLRPGGVFLLESMHRDDVVAQYASRDAWELPDGTRVRARRRFDPVAGVSYEAWRWTGPRGAGSSRHALRLRTATEIAGLLRAAGFERIGYYGDWDLRPLTRDAPRVVAVGAA